MSEERERPLTTADLAAATEKPSPAEPSEPGPAERPEMPAEPQPAGRATAPATEAESAPLFPAEEGQEFRSRWDGIQVSFVDEPRKAVEHADGLVAEVIKRLADTFADERGKIEGQLDRGEDIDTEALRVVLRRYRSFFDRLLSV